MEHYKSTFATVAAAVTGLIMAAHIMQTGPFGEDSRPMERARSSIETPADHTVWVNPPVRVPSPEAAPPMEMPTPPRMALDAPLPPVQASPSQTAVPAPASRKAAASAHRRKVVAQRAAPTRQAVLESRTSTEPAARPTAPVQQPAEANRVDPIGDMIRGLGFGGDRQG